MRPRPSAIERTLAMTYRLPLDVDALRAAVRNGQTFTFTPFYGHTVAPGRITSAVYSQFYPAAFEMDGNLYQWAEQWMMASKARLFADTAALAAILAASHPLECKNSAGKWRATTTSAGTRSASIWLSPAISRSSAKI